MTIEDFIKDYNDIRDDLKELVSENECKNRHIRNFDRDMMYCIGMFKYGSKTRRKMLIKSFRDKLNMIIDENSSDASDALQAFKEKYLGLCKNLEKAVEVVEKEKMPEELEDNLNELCFAIKGMTDEYFAAESRAIIFRQMFIDVMTAKGTYLYDGDKEKLCQTLNEILTDEYYKSVISENFKKEITDFMNKN